jgi:hypothetical protein
MAPPLGGRFTKIAACAVRRGKAARQPMARASLRASQQNTFGHTHDVQSMRASVLPGAWADLSEPSRPHWVHWDDVGGWRPRAGPSWAAHQAPVLQGRVFLACP